jgi:uncharacterized membrane protein
LIYLLIVSLAGLFYYIGNNDYQNRGWLLALASAVASFFGSWAGFLGVFGANLLFYLVLLVYNLLRKKPPGSESGW